MSAIQSSQLHALASESWPNLKPEQKSQWLGKRLALPEAISLKEVSERIDLFIQKHFKELTSAIIHDVLIISHQLQERGINVTALQQRLIKECSQESLDLVTLQEGEAHICLPRVLFAQQSAYFKALLTGNQKEASLKQVTLQEDSLTAISALFSFFENREVNLTADNVLETLEVANKYGVKRLQNSCEQWMLDQVDLLDQREDLWPRICQFDIPFLKQFIIKKTLQAFIKKDGFETAEAQWIAQYGKEFQILDLRQCKVSNDKFQFLLKTCSYVKELNLTHCKGIDDASIHEVANKLSQLTSLNLRECQQLTDDSIIEIAKKLRQLTYLDLWGCEKLTDASIKEVANQLRQLTYLNLCACSKLTDDSIYEVANQLSQLTYLNLSMCEQLTDASIHKVANKLSHLTFLNLGECNELTDVSLKEVANKLSQLTSLGLSWCNQLTDDSLHEVANKLSQLTFLNLWGCEKLTDDSIKEIANKLSQLTFLNLSWCKQLTDDSIQEVANKLSQLTSLDLSECKQLTDDSIIEVANQLSQLTSLNLSMCEKLTDASIQEVVNKLSQLTSLNLSGCKHSYTLIKKLNLACRLEK